MSGCVFASTYFYIPLQLLQQAYIPLFFKEIGLQIICHTLPSSATIFPVFFYFLKDILLETMPVMLYNNRVYAAVGGISDLSREEMIT